MAQAENTFDWSLLQAFVAVAETGSLSAAAKRLGSSQPTLGRQIQTLERQLGARLFRRHARGLALTTTGAELRPKAAEISAAVQALALSAAGSESRIAGTVRIAASEFAAHYLLPGILAQIRIAEPQIKLVLMPSNESSNLLFREADIAVRMYRPSQLDLLAQHITDLPLGVFAARSYLQRRGRPERLADLQAHDLIGYDRNDMIIRAAKAMGWALEPDDFALRCDAQATYWELLRAGCGIGFSQRGVARGDALVEELLLGVELPPLPVWLVAPEALRQTPRLRRVWDLLAAGLKALPR